MITFENEKAIDLEAEETRDLIYGIRIFRKL